MQIDIQEVNSPNADYDRPTRVTANDKGEFRVALNPGEYAIGMYDAVLLKNKAHSPLMVKVMAGQYSEITIDYDMLNVRD